MDEMLKGQIEQRAYEHFMKRGGTHGDHMNDWLKAELEITNSLKKAATKIVSKIAEPKKSSKMSSEKKGRYH
jgi:hypothetical protein